MFVSDLHLTPQEQRTSQVFFRFLRDPAPSAGALYILGDLFDYWIGDDNLEEPLHREVIERLRDLADTGCRVSFMHGNRDFLIGDAFASASGVALLRDPTVIELYGTRTLVMHGDTLCTEDVAYQEYRARVRNEHVQREFLAKPLGERRAIAQGLLQESAAGKQTKTAEIMDVTAGEVEAALRAHDCRLLIHGHTHRPARHRLLVDGRQCERWVLSDWHTRTEAISVGPAGIERIALA